MKTIITAFILWAVILVFASLTAHGQVDSTTVDVESTSDYYEQTQWKSKDGEFCSIRKYNDGMYITAWTDTFYCFISIYDNGDAYWSNDFESSEHSINSEGSEKFMEALQSTIKVMCEIQMKVYHEQLYNKK